MNLSSWNAKSNRKYDESADVLVPIRFYLLGRGEYIAPRYPLGFPTSDNINNCATNRRMITISSGTIICYCTC